MTKYSTLWSWGIIICLSASLPQVCKGTVPDVVGTRSSENRNPSIYVRTTVGDKGKPANNTHGAVVGHTVTDALMGDLCQHVP